MILAMSDIKALIELDFKTVFLGVFTLLFAVKGAVMLWDWFCERFKIKTKKMQDHELLVKTSESLLLLQEKSEKDDRGLECALETFMSEVRDSFDHVNKQFEESNQKQLLRKEQSLNIQKELNDSIKELIAVQKTNAEQIDALMCGNKELLGNTIDERYARYIELGGIPQSEVDDFDDIYIAYRGLNGNHGRQTKYEYVKNHLPVIPVKTELIIK